jgi:hypothetical protein
VSNEATSYRLGDLPVRTTAASVRPFIPDIQEQLRRGVALSTVTDALNERGIPVTASNLSKLLYRARKSGVAAPPTADPRKADDTAPKPLQAYEERMPPGMDPELWTQMSERQKSDARADYYLNRPRPIIGRKD